MGEISKRIFLVFIFAACALVPNRSWAESHETVPGASPRALVPPSSMSPREFETKWGIRLAVGQSVTDKYGGSAAIHRAEAFLQLLSPEERSSMRSITIADPGSTQIVGFIFGDRLSVSVPIEGSLEPLLAELRYGRTANARSFSRWIKGNFRPQQLCINSMKVEHFTTPQDALAITQKFQALAPMIRYLSTFMQIKLNAGSPPRVNYSLVEHIPILVLPYDAPYAQLAAVLQEYCRRRQAMAQVGEWASRSRIGLDINWNLPTEEIFQFGNTLARMLPRIRQSGTRAYVAIKVLENSPYRKSELSTRNGWPVLNVRPQDGQAEIERQLNLLDNFFVQRPPGLQPAPPR